MEREALEIFAVARRAGEAAAADGGSPEVARCLDALRQLRKLPLTTKELVATKGLYNSRNNSLFGRRFIAWRSLVFAASLFLSPAPPFVRADLTLSISLGDPLITMVGKGILCLTKHPQQKIQTVASELRQYWKDLVIEEATNSSRKKNISEDQASPKVREKSDKAATVKVERVQSSGAISVDGIPKSEVLKSERNGLYEWVKADNISESGSVKIKNNVKVESARIDGSGDKSIKVEKVMKEEKQSPLIRPPKLTSMIKCNDELRDKFREIIAEALSKVHDEAPEEIRDEVAACDPVRVAVSVESMMFEKLGRSNGAQKAKYRSIMFNMRDSKNPDLRRRVLLGHVKPAKLITMTPEEMASDERKRQNQQIKDKAIFECERGGPAKATTDQFKCGRCGKRKTTYYQMQTRSADEPMTTYVTCVECNNHWKFC